MIGKGAVYFAVWGYVISKTKKSRVELNPTLLAVIIGEDRADIERALDDMQQPDPESRNKACEGRKLVKEGAFQYYVPSHEFYRKIMDEDQRREYNRERQARHREKERQRQARERESGIKAGADHGEYPTSTEGAMEMHDKAVA